MLLWIFDNDFAQLGMLSNYQSLQWSEDYRGIGSFELHYTDNPDDLTESARVTNMLRHGNYIYQHGKRTAMVIKHLYRNSSSNTIIVRGHTTLDLLSRRAVFPRQSVNLIEVGMYDLVKSSVVNAGADREIPRIVSADAVSGLQGYIQAHATEFIGEQVTDALETLGAAGDLGYFMEFDYKNKRHVFTVYEGLNRTHDGGSAPPAVFSEEFGNLADVIIIDDLSAYKNVAYVAGEQHETRAQVFVTAGSATGLDRRELFVDAGNIKREYRNEAGALMVYTLQQYQALLTARGVEELNKSIRTESFEGMITEIEAWGNKYYLGDKVTCLSKRYGIRLDVRIMSYTEITENNQTRIAVMLGDPEILPWENTK